MHKCLRSLKKILFLLPFFILLATSASALDFGHLIPPGILVPFPPRPELPPEILQPNRVSGEVQLSAEIARIRDFDDDLIFEGEGDGKSFRVEMPVVLFLYGAPLGPEQLERGIQPKVCQSHLTMQYFYADVTTVTEVKMSFQLTRYDEAENSFEAQFQYEFETRRGISVERILVAHPAADQLGTCPTLLDSLGADGLRRALHPRIPGVDDLGMHFRIPGLGEPEPTPTAEPIPHPTVSPVPTETPIGPVTGGGGPTDALNPSGGIPASGGANGGEVPVNVSPEMGGGCSLPAESIPTNPHLFYGIWLGILAVLGGAKIFTSSSCL